MSVKINKMYGVKLLHRAVLYIVHFLFYLIGAKSFEIYDGSDEETSTWKFAIYAGSNADLDVLFDEKDKVI